MVQCCLYLSGLITFSALGFSPKFRYTRPLNVDTSPRSALALFSFSCAYYRSLGCLIFAHCISYSQHGFDLHIHTSRPKCLCQTPRCIVVSFLLQILTVRFKGFCLLMEFLPLSLSLSLSALLSIPTAILLTLAFIWTAAIASLPAFLSPFSSPPAAHYQHPVTSLSKVICLSAAQ